MRLWCTLLSSLSLFHYIFCSSTSFDSSSRHPQKNTVDGLERVAVGNVLIALVVIEEGVEIELCLRQHDEMKLLAAAAAALTAAALE